jgi:hypothetical protein
MNPHRYSVGDKVVITPDRLEHMRWHNRQAAHPNYPSNSYLELVQHFVDVPGVVTHTYPPGYEVCAKFGDQMFHMKDNWIVPA